MLTPSNSRAGGTLKAISVSTEPAYPVRYTHLARHALFQQCSPGHCSTRAMGHPGWRDLPRNTLHIRQTPKIAFRTLTGQPGPCLLFLPRVPSRQQPVGHLETLLQRHNPAERHTPCFSPDSAATARYHTPLRDLGRERGGGCVLSVCWLAGLTLTGQQYAFLPQQARETLSLWPPLPPLPSLALS